MESFFIGVDGGGTKTAAALAPAQKPPVAAVSDQGCSYQMLGIEGAVAVIARTVAALLQKAGASAEGCKGCCIGLPCYGEDEKNDAVISQALRRALAPLPVHIVNDVEVGWAGALHAQPGIHIVVGTGAIAFARNEAGQAARCGGWNEFFGDEGSCYWVGREAMSLFTKQADGRMKKGALYELVRQALSLDKDMDFIELVLRDYAPYRDKVASFQRFAAQAAQEKDASVLQLYARAAKELAEMADALRRSLQMPEGTRVSYSGGLFHAGDAILLPLKKEMDALHCTLQPPQASAVQGALLLAAQKFQNSLR